MIEEVYVSFEIAKLLKENGFNEPCHAYYEDNGIFRESYSAHAIRNITNPCFFGIAASTQQMAIRWLREKHNIKIEILITGNAWFYNIVTEGINGVNKIPSPAGFTYSYEDAVEAAIKYSLKNLI